MTLNNISFVTDFTFNIYEGFDEIILLYEYIYIKSTKLLTIYNKE